MSTSLELWRSDSGSVEDLAFHLIDSLPDTPFALNDLNVVPGRLYIYKLRRYDPLLLAYSAWSALAFAVAPWPQGVSPVGNTYTGYQSKLGIGREATYGSPVLAQKLVDRLSGQLEMALETIDHEVLMGITSDIEGIPGLAPVSGTLKTTLTPEGHTRLLQAAVGDPTFTTIAAQTTPVAAATVVANGGGAAGGTLAAGAYMMKYTIANLSGETAASPESAVFNPAAGNIPQITFPAAPAPGNWYNVYVTPVGGAAGSEVLYATMVTTATYNLAVLAPASTTAPPAANTATATFSKVTFKDSFNFVPHTLTEVRGPSFLAYPGAVVGGITINVDKTQKTPVQVDYEVMALNEIEEATEAAIGTNAVGMDPLAAYSPVDAQLSIAGQVSQAAKTYNAVIKFNREPKDVLNGNRGPASHYRKKSEVSATMTLYFEDVSQVTTFYGQIAAAARPFGAKRKVNVVPVVLSIVSVPNGPAPTGFKNGFVLTLPKAAIKKLTRAVNGQEPLMQQIEIKGYYDLVSGTPFQIDIYNSETQVALTAAGTAFGAGTVPANDVQSLVV